MTFANLVNKLTLTIATTGLVGMSSLTVSSHAEAAAFSATNWTGIGDVQLSLVPISLSNNIGVPADDPDLVSSLQPDGSFNFSGISTVTNIGDLETFLGLPFGSLDASSFEGSAIAQTFDARSGDSLTIDFDFLTNELAPGFGSANEVFNDVAFFVVNGTVVLPAFAQAASASNSFANPFGFRGGYSSSFTYTFDTTGQTTIGLGILDIGDVIGTSALRLTNTQYTPIPTPALLPGLIGLGLGVWRKRKQVGEG